MQHRLPPGILPGGILVKKSKRIDGMYKKIFFMLIVTIAVLLFQTVYAETPALLKDLDVTNGFMIQFDKDTLTYTVELDEGENLAEVIAVPKNDECIVEIHGAEEKVTPGTERVITVSVHDMQGNFATYTLKVYAKAQQGGLSFLRCLNGTMSPQYRETARNFYIILPNDCDHAELDIRTWDEDAIVDISGNENIEEGKRQRAIMTITDTDGTVSEYALYIYRRSETVSNVDTSFLLSDIQINDGSVPIEFEQTKGYYRIAVSESVSKLDIDAFAEDRKNIVEITGTDTITDNEHNIVIINVSNPDDETQGKSIYVLDFFRESFMTTPKYTDFQLTVMIISACLITCLLLLLYSFLHKKRKNHYTDDTEQPLEKHSMKAEDAKDLSLRS